MLEALEHQTQIDEQRRSCMAEAVRTLAEQRAGLRPTTHAGSGTPILRALSLFLAEDTKVITELEQLLGPRRAEALLNHNDMPHSDHVFGVGPRPNP
jgi:hypothetical protein